MRRGSWRATTTSTRAAPPREVGGGRSTCRCAGAATGFGSASAAGAATRRLGARERGLVRRAPHARGDECREQPTRDEEREARPTRARDDADGACAHAPGPRRLRRGFRGGHAIDQPQRTCAAGSPRERTRRVGNLDRRTTQVRPLGPERDVGRPRHKPETGRGELLAELPRSGRRRGCPRRRTVPWRARTGADRRRRAGDRGASGDRESSGTPASPARSSARCATRAHRPRPRPGRRRARRAHRSRGRSRIPAHPAARAAPREARGIGPRAGDALRAGERASRVEATPRSRARTRRSVPKVRQRTSWNTSSVTATPRTPPSTTSETLCTPASTRVCATSSAISRARLAIST